MIYPARQQFNFDTAIRYGPIVEEIERSRRKESPVLEIGSGGSGISDYFSGQVIGIDTDFSKTGTKKNQNIKYIKASVFKLPFKTNSFYQVVCLDTLEHIQVNRRREAIKEMLRITKKGGKIFLGFPFGEKSIRMEGRINNLFKKVYGKDHLWLLEHKKNGLPKIEDVKQYLLDCGIKENQFEISYNANLLCWFLLHWFFTVNPGKFLSRVLRLAYKQLFFLLRINLPPYYRAIFTIKK